MCKRVMAQCGLCAALAVASLSPALAGKAQSPATPEYADGKLGMSMMSAQVRKDGVVTFAAGAMSAQYLPSFKRYMVKFNRPVTGCPSVVTPLYEQGVAVAIRTVPTRIPWRSRSWMSLRASMWRATSRS